MEPIVIDKKENKFKVERLCIETYFYRQIVYIFSILVKKLLLKHKFKIIILFFIHITNYKHHKSCYNQHFLELLLCTFLRKSKDV